MLLSIICVLLISRHLLSLARLLGALHSCSRLDSLCAMYTHLAIYQSASFTGSYIRCLAHFDRTLYFLHHLHEYLQVAHKSIGCCFCLIQILAAI